MSKIDPIKLNELTKNGKSLKELAEYFNVSKVAIWKYQKRLKELTTKQITRKPMTVQRIINKNLNTIDQLQKINNYANELLDLLMRWNKGDPEALQILESQVRKVKVRGHEEEVTEYRFKDPRELAIKAMGEIRGQLGPSTRNISKPYTMSRPQPNFRRRF